LKTTAWLNNLKVFILDWNAPDSAVWNSC